MVWLKKKCLKIVEKVTGGRNGSYYISVSLASLYHFDSDQLWNGRDNGPAGFQYQRQVNNKQTSILTNSLRY